MYTVEKNVQIIISLLKSYNIKRLVLSPGSRNVPFVHSVEHDSFFECYSVVDERSAGYFALGLAEASDEPVVLSCTSSTASSNYFPAVEEAYKRGIKLVVLTADRNPHFRGQMENQMIEQPEMYGLYCNKAVNLPIVNTDADKKYCERLVNEALWGVSWGNRGPVQINFPVYKNFRDFTVQKLPKCRKIDLVKLENKSLLKEKIQRLKNANRIMFLFGESSGYTDEEINELNKIYEGYNCFFSVEHMSNLNCSGTLRTFIATESMTSETVEKFLPDILVTIGTNFASDFKPKLRVFSDKFSHWRISEKGDIVDTFMALDTVFECSDADFFKVLAEYVCGQSNDKVYYNMWRDKINSIRYPDLKYTNFYAIGELLRCIKEGSILHLSILNSIRLSQFFNIADNVKVFANVGAYGIDGSLSTFYGQAIENEGLSYLIIGDLSYFYDMSAMFAVQNIPNARIFLINNHGGGEFHYVYNGANFKDIDKHISAGHKTDAQLWAEGFNVKYLSAHNRDDLGKALKEFTAPDSGAPIILEIFTNMDTDADTLVEFYKINKERNLKNDSIVLIKHGVKNILRKIKK